MSETAKHAPGPWKFEKVEKWPFGVIVTDANGEMVFAQQAFGYATGQKTRADNENAVGFPVTEKEEVATRIAQQDANARLIAASPQLLETLAFVAKWFAMREAMGETFPSQLTSSVRAAIAKAEGRT